MGPTGDGALIPTEMWLLLEEESLKLGSFFRKPFSGRKGDNSFVACPCELCDNL